MNNEINNLALDADFPQLNRAMPIAHAKSSRAYCIAYLNVYDIRMRQRAARGTRPIDS